jgi:hypothetical protein
MNLQIPSTNIQRSAKLQTPNGNCKQPDVWRLDFLWSLDVGAWSFVHPVDWRFI